jgi:HAD superfamily hydrolase (TIGR01509 family)
VVRLIEQLEERQIRLAVVTTTWRANVETVLKVSGLLEAFEVIVAKQDVSALKPDPEGYRLALQKLGLAASEAVAIEDSPTGLASARGAGVRAIAVGHRRESGEWSGDAAFVPALNDLEATLAAIDGVVPEA